MALDTNRRSSDAIVRPWYERGQALLVSVQRGPQSAVPEMRWKQCTLQLVGKSSDSHVFDARTPGVKISHRTDVPAILQPTWSGSVDARSDGRLETAWVVLDSREHRMQLVLISQTVAL